MFPILTPPDAPAAHYLLRHTDHPDWEAATEEVFGLLREHRLTLDHALEQLAARGVITILSEQEGRARLQREAAVEESGPYTVHGPGGWVRVSPTGHGTFVLSRQKPSGAYRRVTEVQAGELDNEVRRLTHPAAA